MKKLALLSILLLLILSSGLSAHDIRLAIFELKENEKNGFALTVSFDKEDCRKAFPTINGALPDKETIETYLKENFQLTLNDQCVNSSISSITEEGDFVRIVLEINDFKETVKKVRIFNTCLIEKIDGHSNIFRALINGKSRSFRLTESRITTEFKY